MRSQIKLSRHGHIWGPIALSHLPLPPPPLLLPQGSAGCPKRGSRWVLFSETAADISLPSQLIYSPPSSTRPNLQQTTPPLQNHHQPLFLCAHTLSLSLCPLYLSPPLPLSLWLRVKTPAARSSGDKSDHPGRVIVKHPPGRLRPPHPFNSSAGIASQKRRRALHAAA